jgi:hypothetical protein
VAQACRLADRDARVVSTLGGFRQSAPVDYQGNRHVIDEMERAGLSRLLLVTSLGCGDSWQYLPSGLAPPSDTRYASRAWRKAGCRQAPLSGPFYAPQGCRMGAHGSGHPEPGQERHGLVRRQDVAIRGL